MNNGIMVVKDYKKVLLDKSLSPNTRLVYIYLCERPKKLWRNYTAMCKEIGLELGLCRNTLVKCFGELQYAGLIDIEKMLERENIKFHLVQTIGNKRIDIKPLFNEDGLRELFNNWLTESGQKKDYLTTADVCRMLHITKPTLWRWMKAGYLVPTKIGKRNYYSLSDINALRR